MEVGPVMQGGMGAAAVTHQEIRAWRKEIGLRLTAFEVRALRHLSIEYLQQAVKSTDPECLPPYGPMANRRTVLDKITQVFG